MGFLGSSGLKAVINSGKDVHCYLASEVCGIPYDEFYAAWKDDKHPDHNTYSKRRSNIKGLAFGVLYGAGPARVAHITGMSFEEASALIKRFYDKARVLKSWLDDQGAQASTYGWTKPLRGRKRLYDLPTKEAETEAKTVKAQREARKAREEK
jgi:DNA polymerase I